MTEPRPPANRCATLRQTLAETLRAGEYSAHELSRLVGIPEKTVADHLSHLAQSLPRHPENPMEQIVELALQRTQLPCRIPTNR